MARGLSRRQKYDWVRRQLVRLEKWARTLPGVYEVFRKGGSHLAIHHDKRCLALLVQYQWIHASNGECAALVVLDGKTAPAFGNVRDRIKAALGIPE